MAFKGKTTAGYKSTTGKQLSGAKTGGKVGHNPRKPLPNSKTNVVTKASRAGSNPSNSRTQKLNANRVQRAGGAKTNPKNSANNPAIKTAIPRTTNSLNKAPFTGYNRLTNSSNVPAGKGNIRNSGSVQRNDVSRIRGSLKMAMPPKAISGGKKGGFGGFIGGK
jgi:hypothetical protein